jgi:hypothetical protein
MLSVHFIYCYKSKNLVAFTYIPAFNFAQSAHNDLCKRWEGENEKDNFNDAVFAGVYKLPVCPGLCSRAAGRRSGGWHTDEH